ncbi:bifunctional Nucleotidyltransferase superfamily/Poly A polymerase [Babesia duncani]|uniref:Bifunctional Nucleotidyltransferase superfamily/Poly A polymerase n=1 Tax=Babesia duncani TaxID=323732 RepID=A0AAD9UNP7_9APIC|nr:bifunctional Nucleotidyltransferase superfamily/Poly A polymerase [Babesia duncani]
MNSWKSLLGISSVLASTRRGYDFKRKLTNPRCGECNFINTTGHAIMSSATPNLSKMDKKYNCNSAVIANMNSGEEIDVDVYINGSSEPCEKIPIFITENERQLFDLLLKCTEYHGLKAELRVAGGWVRDKILNKTSDDIDIALDIMTGVEFCEYLNKFTSDNLGFQKSVGVVKRRPEQSKHLETATLNILGFDIDFVNLRCEDYAADSRIPIMRIGTPKEDANRRDFTINSLFYNITKNCLEDWTGLGISDLRSNIIRACGAAAETFSDDPLRVIRAIRFSSRFSYKLDDEIINAINDKLLNELLVKVWIDRHGSPIVQVTRPRIAQELVHMLARENIAQAFDMLHSFKILGMLMRDGDQQPTDSIIKQGNDMIQALSETFCEISDTNLAMKYTYLGALIYYFKEEKYSPKQTLVERVIKDNMKLPTKHANSALAIAKGVDMYHALYPDIDKVQLGLAMRFLGPLWKESLLLSTCVPLNGNKLGVPFYHQVMAKVDSESLEQVLTLKAPITGDELKRVLPKIRVGPEFKSALDFQVENLIAQPDLEKDMLEQMLKQHFVKYC